MKHIRTINKANLKETAKKGGCGMSGFMPVRMQNFLHSGKPEM